MSLLPQPLTGIAAGISGIGAGINTAAFIIGGLAGTGSPGETQGQFPVSLGTVAFKGFEVPEAAPWGGGQALTIHKLVGGARIIDAMGPDDRAIKLKGTFLSADADARALRIDAYRKTGAPVGFLYANHLYSVVIKAFEPDYKRPDHIPYSLELEVLKDLTQPPTAPALSASTLFGLSLSGLASAAAALTGGLLAVASVSFATVEAAFAAVTAAIGTAEALATAASLGIVSAISQQQTAIAALLAAVAGGIAGPVVAGIGAPLAIGGSLEATSADNLAAMLAPILAAQTMVQAALDYGETYLAALPVLGGVAGGAQPGVAAANLTGAAALSQAYATLQQLQAELANMARIIATTGA